MNISDILTDSVIDCKTHLTSLDFFSIHYGYVKNRARTNRNWL